MRGDGHAHHLEYPLDQRTFRLVAIRKAGIVGDIDVMRGGERRLDLAEHREAADAGIENKYGRRARHTRASNWPSSSKPCGQKPSRDAELIWPSSGISQ